MAKLIKCEGSGKPGRGLGGFGKFCPVCSKLLWTRDGSTLPVHGTRAA